jgi:hypothetical protein
MGTLLYGVVPNRIEKIQEFNTFENERYKAKYVLHCKCRQCCKIFIDCCKQGTPNLYSEANLNDYYSNATLRDHKCKNGHWGFADIIGYETIDTYNKRK